MAEKNRRQRSVTVPRLVSTTAPDSCRLWTRVWDDASEPAARVVLLHGIVSHGAWYLKTGRFLAKAGMEVHLPDRRGSGLDHGGSGDVDVWEQWPADVEEYLLTLGQHQPIILLGISWGAKLAVAIARRRRVPLAGLGLISPGLFARQSAGTFKRILLRLLGRGPLRKVCVPLPLDDPALFTEDPTWQEYIRADPLALRRITIGFAREDIRLTQWATSVAPPLDLPTLLMLAGKDRIVRHRDTRAFVQALTTNRTTIFEYPTAAHTLEFDAAVQSYLDDLRTWIFSVIRPSTCV